MRSIQVVQMNNDTSSDTYAYLLLDAVINEAIDKYGLSEKIL